MESEPMGSGAAAALIPLSGRPSTWSVDQVATWLHEQKLGELVPLFRRHRINGAALVRLNRRLILQMDPSMAFGDLVVLTASVKMAKDEDGREDATTSNVPTSAPAPQASSAGPAGNAPEQASSESRTCVCS